MMKELKLILIKIYLKTQLHNAYALILSDREIQLQSDCSKMHILS